MITRIVKFVKERIRRSQVRVLPSALLKPSFCGVL
jgi:hypothetical protein